MSLETKIVSRIVLDGSMREVKKLGVTPSLFRTDNGIVPFEWLWNEYHAKDTRGETPSVERFLDNFPEFEMEEPKDSAAALIKDLRRRYGSKDLETLAEKIDKMIEEGEDVEYILAHSKQELLRINSNTTSANGTLFSEGAQELMDLYYTMKECGGVAGHQFPWKPLNDIAGGMAPGELIIIYGRPGNLKTWVACCMAVQAFADNLRVMFFSKEMTRLQIMWRCASIIAEVNATDAWRGALNEADEELYMAVLESIVEADHSEGSVLFIGNEGTKDVASVDTLHAIAEDFDPDIIFIDGFYHLTDARSKKRSTDWQQVAHIAQDMKNLAQAMNCSVVGITQANRDKADKPTGDLTDLSYADAIGQEADLAMRCIKGPNPEVAGAEAVCIFPSKVRNGKGKPFLIHGIPSEDFSLIDEYCNVKNFLKSKEQAAAASGEGTAGGRASRRGDYRL